jgi:transcriptional regulator with XRE-family HTH domain
MGDISLHQSGRLVATEVNRRRLRVALRRAREAAPMTQKMAANALDWSVSKINRLEQGLVHASWPDVLAMLKAYGVTDEERIEELTTLARESRDLG